jgi:hypothetical protein
MSKISVFTEDAKNYKSNGISPYTKPKQEKLVEILNIHTTFRSFLLDNYVYIDMNAGRGEYNGIKGSPIIAAEIVKDKKITYPKFFLFEKDKKEMENLKKVFPTNKFNHVQFLNCDNRNFDSVPKNLFNTIRTLVYFDSCGELTNFNLINQIADKHQKIDILVNFASSIPKRLGGVFKNIDYSEMNNILNVNRRFCLGTLPTQKFGWSFLFFTNKIMIADELMNIGFYNLKDNKKVLEEICLSKKENSRVEKEHKKCYDINLFNKLNTENKYCKKCGVLIDENNFHLEYGNGKRYIRSKLCRIHFLERHKNVYYKKYKEKRENAKFETKNQTIIKEPQLKGNNKIEVRCQENFFSKIKNFIKDKITKIVAT